jgi:hypothetical protein
VNWPLDTDVICQPGERHGDARAVAWLEQEKNHCYISAVVIAQLAYWVRTKEGQRRRQAPAGLATGNEYDFSRPGVKVFNPFKELRKS